MCHDYSGLPYKMAAPTLNADSHSACRSAWAAPAIGAHYANLSTLFWEAAHATLAGRGSAAENLAALEDRLRLLRLRAGW